MHGGLRYLQMLDFHLVREALTERDLLINRLAPHLVKPVSFLYPLENRVWERAYVGAGVALYDTLASVTGSKRALPIHRHLTRKGMERLFPDLRHDAADRRGPVLGRQRRRRPPRRDPRPHRRQLRRARRVPHPGGRACRPRTGGAVTGAEVVDLETGEHIDVRARAVINATGVWTEQTESLAGAEGGLRVLASKGVHIVVPRSRIAGDVGLILQTEKSVLFIIPWSRYWVIGTTDTPWEQELMHPVATSADIDYVHRARQRRAVPADHARGHHRHLGRPASAAPAAGQGGHQLRQGVARAHRRLPRAGPDGHRRRQAHHLPRDGQGRGRLRHRQPRHQPAVHHARPAAGRRRGPPGVPAPGPGDQPEVRLDAGRAWTTCCTGTASLLGELIDLVDADPALAEPLKNADAYIGAEIVYAASHEGALHLDDVLMHRTRLNYEQADKGVGALEEIADLVAPVLGWDAHTRSQEIEAYRARAEAEDAAAQELDDAEAEKVRLRAADVVADARRRRRGRRRHQAGITRREGVVRTRSGPEDSPRPSAGRT